MRERDKLVRSATDEKADKMGRAQKADLFFVKPERQAGDSIQRAHTSGGELQQDHRKKQGGEGNQQAHNAKS